MPGLSLTTLGWWGRRGVVRERNAMNYENIREFAERHREVARAIWAGDRGCHDGIDSAMIISVLCGAVLDLLDERERKETK